MAKGRRRPGRRALIAATFAAALVGAALGILLTRGGGSNAEASVSANALGVIDADAGEIAAQIPVGVAPGRIAASKDAVWASSTGESTVSGIDPGSNRVSQTVVVGNGRACRSRGARARQVDRLHRVGSARVGTGGREIKTE